MGPPDQQPPGSGPPDPRRGQLLALMLASAVFLWLVSPANPTVSVNEIETAAANVKMWALKFGMDVSVSCAAATCSKKIKENYNQLQATVEWVKGSDLQKEMGIDVQNMMAWKAEVVKKIREVAEQAVLKHKDEPDIKIRYNNAKKMYDSSEGPPEEKTEEWNEMTFTPHRNYDGTAVNMMTSALHIPTNVFDKSPDVLNAIKWSEELNPTFKNNIAFDPSLSWQFFGSSTGFLRLYPAIRWRVPEGPDMYDCRMRSWYIQAAASAKDIVILLDGSGSMTGLRKEIARNVVLNILETLSDNDFVTILRFAENVKSVVPCFEDILVQANERNLREFREYLKDLDTVNIANFTLGLKTAFELLQKVARNKEGSQCNQAIMLITDGAPDTYEKIFEQYNWPNIPIRVFTYLIGREVTDMDEVQWMACNNRGYYTHVTTLAEVREQVQKYIPVMSRPLVLQGVHPFVWSSVYADVGDVKLSDWLWQERERAKIRKMIFKDRETRQKTDAMQDSKDTNTSEMEALAGGPMSDFAGEPETSRKAQKKKNSQNSSPSSTVQLMTTVATPVFDRRNFSMRVANILGVAGTDVPIREIIKLTPPYKLGVNGYSFVVTNNGYVLYHPDLRPLFQEMLKPLYSSVDMAEVELADNNLGPREFDEQLLEIKNMTIDRQIGWKGLRVKIHLDSMRRVITRNNSYYWGPIENTPFSLVIVLPDPYGHYRVVGQIEVKRRLEDLKNYFRGNNWRVHPNWVYCENLKKEGDTYISPEDRIRIFLDDALNSQNFRWRPATTIRPPPYGNLLCEKDLVQSLVFDAKATDVDSKACAPYKIPPYEHEDKVIKMHGIVTTFVATRSGLLRYEDHRTEEEKANSTDRPFYEIHTKATDEVFYRRAVDYYYINDTAFVFSVPFDAGQRNDSLVTVSQAIFLGKGSRRAPVAVVGLQFKHSVFAERFTNITGTCLQGCTHKCTDDALDCYLLDNNGFIVFSETFEHTGKFFGEIDYTIFENLIEKKIYRKVHIFDYQSICIDIIMPSGPASYLSTPVLHLKNIFYWFWSKILVLFVQYNLFSWWTEKTSSALEYNYHDDNNEEEQFHQNKTRPRPCDKEFDLYEMLKPNTWEPVKGVIQRCPSKGCDKDFIIQQVPYTNLLMLVIYTQCDCMLESVTLEPREVEYLEHERCQRMRNGTLRKLPECCVSYDSAEASIRQQCGMGSQLRASIYSLVGAILLHWSVLIV